MDNSGTIYVLGAGASIGAKRYPDIKGMYADKRMPSGENFFYDLFHSDKPYPSGYDFINLFGAGYEGINRLILQTYKIKDEDSFFYGEPWKGLNIENIFTHIDIGTKMYGRSTGYYRIFKMAKEELVHFISVMLLMRSIGQRCLYLQKIFKNLDDNDTVVSFNWDTIADVTLEYLLKPHLINYFDLLTSNKRTSTFYSKPMYLKLHGSLNWAVCRNKKCKKNGINVLIKSKYNDLKHITLSDIKACEECGSSLDINIIPPCSDKIDIHKNNLYAKQWRVIRNKFKVSNKIVFIGYSFPTTDFYSEWLFRQINYLVINPEQNQFVEYEIEVVNPEAFYENSQLKKRYESIFKGHNIKYYHDLKEYVKLVK